MNPLGASPGLVIYKLIDNKTKKIFEKYETKLKKIGMVISF